MRQRDLFSGIGGFALAASWVWGAAHELITFCERDAFCQKILKKHWPDVVCIDDIHELQGGHDGPVDLLTGGFPCQPFSVAGKRRGAADDRALWPEMFRVIHEDQPRWVLAENVPGIVNLALDQVLADLESAGYATETFIIPACAVNAPHRRDRIWIVAHSERDGRGRWSDGDARGDGGKVQIARPSAGKEPGVLADADGQRQQEQRQPVANAAQFADVELFGQFATDANRQHADNRRFGTSGVSQFITSGIRDGQQWESESGICRVADGIPNRVVRLRSLGNAIVPQVAAVFFEMMKRVEEVSG